VYGERVISGELVFEWCKQSFKGKDRVEVHSSPGHLTSKLSEKIGKVRIIVLNDLCFTVGTITEELIISSII
jgi:hypothetical protein